MAVATKGVDMTFKDNGPAVLREIKDLIRPRMEDFLDNAVGLMKRPPPEGAPIAGRYDARQPNPERTLLNSPGRGGNLRDNIVAEPLGDMEWRVVLRTGTAGRGAGGRFTKAIGYSAYVVLGTKHMVPRDFPTRAFTEAKKDFVKSFR